MICNVFYHWNELLFFRDLVREGMKVQGGYQGNFLRFKIEKGMQKISKTIHYTSKILH